MNRYRGLLFYLFFKFTFMFLLRAAIKNVSQKKHTL